MTQTELRERGWHTWYNDNYWVHPASVTDERSQDYTNYGFCFDDAVKYEQLGRPKFAMTGIPGLSQLKMALDTKGLTESRSPETPGVGEG